MQSCLICVHTLNEYLIEVYIEFIIIYIFLYLLYLIQMNKIEAMGSTHFRASGTLCPIKTSVMDTG